MNSEEYRFAKDLIDFINTSPSTFHVVRNIKASLIKRGFTELNPSESWILEKCGAYFVSLNESSVVLFRIGTADIVKAGFKIIAAHTDVPTIKIKPDPEITVENSYLKLNTETYGGAILSAWFDRPLSLAGRVTLKSTNPLHPETRYVFIRRPLLIIPNLAIHLNREINEGFAINKQTHLQPLLFTVKNEFEKEGFLINLLSEEIKVNPESILDFDLNLCDYHGGEIIGLNNEFISSGKLDNLAMIHAAIDAFINVKNNIATNVMVCFDNEEVGSITRQGAGSPFFRNILERIAINLNADREGFLRALHNSFLISADMAHALHPNFADKHDPVNRPIINKGPVIKINANQKYTSDSNSSAVFEMLCQKAGVNVQKFVNRSDLTGGSTLGSIATSQLEIRSVDVGNPMLAMHSIRELCGIYDHFSIRKCFEEFYKTN